MQTVNIWGVLADAFPFPGDREKKKAATDVFTGEEIDALDIRQLQGMTREELLRLDRKLSDTIDDFYAPDGCEVDSPEWRRWEDRLDRLDLMSDAVEELLGEDAEEGNE